MHAWIIPLRLLTSMLNFKHCKCTGVKYRWFETHFTWSVQQKSCCSSISVPMESLPQWLFLTTDRTRAVIAVYYECDERCNAIERSLGRPTSSPPPTPVQPLHLCHPSPSCLVFPPAPSWFPDQIPNLVLSAGKTIHLGFIRQILCNS